MRLLQKNVRFVPDYPHIYIHACFAGYLYEVEMVEEQNKELIPEHELYEPTRTAPMLQSNDVPITCLKYS